MLRFYPLSYQDQFGLINLAMKAQLEGAGQFKWVQVSLNGCRSIQVGAGQFKWVQVNSSGCINAAWFKVKIKVVIEDTFFVSSTAMRRKCSPKDLACIKRRKCRGSGCTKCPPGKKPRTDGRRGCIGKYFTYSNNNIGYDNNNNNNDN